MPGPKINRIKEVLRQQGRSNKWLAAQLEKTEVTISRWCQNSQQPDLITLFRVAEILGVSPKDLLVDITTDNDVT